MLYVLYERLNKGSVMGIKKKILAQCRAFKKEFGTIYYTAVTGQMIYLLTDEKVVDKKFAMTNQACNKAVIEWLAEYEITRVYIRYPFSDIWFIDFLTELRKMKVKCVLEFPTIPYDGEDGVLRPIEDQYYREQLCNHVDCCTAYANYETVFNIPCIPLVNGVDVDANKCKKQRNKNKNELVLLAVATMRREHGYERIIKGLYEYYQSGGKREIYFNLAGDGPQIKYYEQLVAKYELEKRVCFYGFLQGEKLDDIYNGSDIGVGALGMYKSGLSVGVGIKAAEYCVKSLPMIMVDDYGFENKYYLLKVPNDETSINMDDVIDFYDSLQDKEYISEMYDYAVGKYSWDKVLKPVVAYLNKN